MSRLEIYNEKKGSRMPFFLLFSGKSLLFLFDLPTRKKLNEIPCYHAWLSNELFRHRKDQIRPKKLWLSSGRKY